MAASTKSARQSKMNKNAKQAPAKKPSAPAKKQKPAPAPVQEVVETKNQQGRRIQDAMNAALLTVEQIAAKTGLTLGRVNEHVNYEVSKGRSKLDTKKRVVVVSQPRYRNEG
jgi:hypothetical protein